MLTAEFEAEDEPEAPPASDDYRGETTAEDSEA